jgi:hypothetical protein
MAGKKKRRGVPGMKFKMRAARSSYAKQADPKGDRFKIGTPLTQEERVQYALTRLRSARARAAAHPDDAALRVAVESRRKEWERELLALERVNARRA